MVRRRTTGLRRLATLGLATLAVSCVGPDVGFDATRARAHIDTLAGTIGSRPHGSPESALARDYIVDQLQSLGLSVRVQETDAVDPGRGLTARVRNIIGWRDGELDEAIALVSHYDSRPEASGALDDALGVATSLEAARILVAGAPMRHALFVLVTDAEEVGLMGARGVVTDPEVARRVRAFLNFDGTGGAGGSVLFETTGGTALAAWADGAGAPDGGSFTAEIYRRMPNDTDFTILRELGAAGLNFAAVGDSYAYHTDRDVPSRVRTATLFHATGNAVTTIRALDAMELASGEALPTYFDLARTRGVVYGPVAATIAAVVASVLGAVAWVLIAADGRRQRGLSGLLVTGVAGVLVAFAGGVGMLIAARLVLAIRPEVVPWYAAPSPYFVCLATAGALAGWSVARLVGSLPKRARLWRAPGAVWFIALPVWVAVTATLHVVAPTASYLTTLPLLITSATLLVSWRSSSWIRLASIVALAVSALFWVTNTVRLLGFLPALLGWMPVGAPVWIYPALLGAAGVMLVPCVAALLVGRKVAMIRSSRVLVLLLVALVASGGLALMTPAYTEHRPQRRAALYVQDHVTGQGRWEVGGAEPLTDLTESSPGARWGAIGSVAAPATRVASVRGPLRVETASAALVDDERLPAVVRAELVPGPAGGQELVITIVPRTLTAAEIRLPPGIVPLDSSLAGRITDDRWTATYAAVPFAGLSVRLGLGAVTLQELRQSVVALTTATLPGGRQPNELPAWLPTEHTTWSVRSVFLIGVLP